LNLIDTAKAETDLWVNLWFLSLATIADAILAWRFPGALLAGSKRQWVGKLLDKLVKFAKCARHLSVALSSVDIAPYFQPLLTGVGALALAFFASWMAARAAIEWGSTFKAASTYIFPRFTLALDFPSLRTGRTLETVGTGSVMQSPTAGPISCKQRGRPRRWRVRHRPWQSPKPH